jgi:hypothetical protein
MPSSGWEAGYENKKEKCTLEEPSFQKYLGSAPSKGAGARNTPVYAARVLADLMGQGWRRKPRQALLTQVLFLLGQRGMAQAQVLLRPQIQNIPCCGALAVSTALGCEQGGGVVQGGILSVLA